MDLAAAHPSTLFAEQAAGRWRGPGYVPLKRWPDLLAAAFLLVLFGPLMLVIALGIKLHSSGPILYRQKPIGKDGRSFDMLKFRSMRDGAASNPHREHGPRLIREHTRPEDLGSTTLKLRNDQRSTALTCV